MLNAANTPKDLDWLRSHLGTLDVEVVDESDRWCQLAVQGPAAERILDPLCEADLESMRYYGFARCKVDGVRCIVIGFQAS